MLKRGLIILMFLTMGNGFSQVPVFDKLEILYSQKHYKTVYRRANRLLDVPEFDYSFFPELYKSLALFQLSCNERWLKRHKNSLQEAKNIFKSVSDDPKGMSLIKVHISDIISLNKDLQLYENELLKSGDLLYANELKSVRLEIFSGIPEIDPNELLDAENSVEKPEIVTLRDSIVAFAKKFIGVPYVWAGNDPTGFDCSGYTCYVFRNSGKQLPRRAVDQYEKSHKIKQHNVQKGDLVFFDNGSGISHVGLIVSEKGKPLVMIHASSSKGIMITEIEKSEYWLTRLKGFGSYLY
jgi:hypothetical protein